MGDDELTAVFARQLGLVTRTQARDAGLTDRMVHQRVRSGRWVRVGGGVYRLAGVPVTWSHKALAACLVAGPGAAISHQAAAVVWAVSGFRPGSVHITVPPGRNNRSELATVHRRLLLAGEVTTHDRLPVVRPARLLADLAVTVGSGLLTEAVDDVLCRRLVTLDRLLAAGPHPPALRQVLEAWTPGAMAGSPAEMALVRALLAAGLPPPVRQFWLAEACARLDVAYPHDRVAIELDSFRWHGGRRPFEADRGRGNRIAAAGWHLLRATPGDLGAVVAAARSLVRRAS
jgi:hypothetical protein